MCAVRSGSIDCLALLLNSGLNPFHLNALGQDVLTLGNILHPTGFMTSCIEQAIEQWKTNLSEEQLKGFIQNQQTVSTNLRSK